MATKIGFKIKRFIGLLLETALMLTMIFCLLFADLVQYGLGQAKGQLSIVWNAKPIEEVLKDPSFPDSLKNKLMLVQEIRQFAFDSLGIKPNDNYTTVYNQEGKPLLWVVTGSEPYELKAKEWYFPVVGSVSYKGFFVMEKAEQEELKLIAEGYDTDIGKVGGWSTLGWFKDPILSGMLNYQEGDLANLIIHELTHGTLYVKNDVDFNENLASFIGDKGAERFLQYKYGKDSKQYKDYIYEDSDEDSLNIYMLAAAEKAKNLYTSLIGKPESEKKRAKALLFKDIATGLYKVPFAERDTAVIRRINKRLFHAGNAFLMAFIRYDSEQDDFEKEFAEKFGSDVRKYLIYLKEKYPN